MTCDIHIVSVHLLSGFQIHFTVNTAHAKHILILQIRAVGPPVNLHTYEVLLTGLQVFGHIKLTVVVGALGISHLLAIYPYVGCAVYSVEMQIYLTSVPFGRYLYRTSVTAYGIGFIQDCIAILASDEGWQIAEGISHIGIDGGSVSLHLPAGRHGNLFPLAVIISHLIEIDGPVFGLGNPIELPHSVERKAQAAMRIKPGFGVGIVCLHLFFVGIQQHGCSSGFFIDTEYCLVFPVVVAFLQISKRRNLQIGLYQFPSYRSVLLVGIHLPHMATRLTIVLVAQFQTACSRNEQVCILTHGFQLPLLVRVVGIYVPRTYLSFLLSIVSIVQCHLCLWIHQDVMTVTAALGQIPHLEARLLVYGIEGNHTSCTFQGHSVIDLQSVPLCGRKVLS